MRALLIANRGEIAVRIAAACRALGVRSIAAYSDADRDSVAAGVTDEAIAADYRSVASIIDAAARTGADAVHPGYGFLSEQPDLARACAARGLTFIGPSAAAIARMGSKVEAKRLAAEIGIPIVPGYDGGDQTVDRLCAAADRIGYPVLVKASAGGGGRGMRRIDTAAALAPAVEAARHEAERAFGDGRLLLERLITAPRHIEVQLAGDRHGGLVHLFERDCSVQRGYQKVIEEAPAPGLPHAVRQSLYDAALAIGRAIAYDSLGTVEFLVDATTGEHWFLEMNTRLQVEHPVTEAVTGVDLVTLQIRIAAGEPLPSAQQDLAVRGWAIEARVSAEDPAHGYRPQIGTVRAYHVPSGAGVRIDSGIARGSVVTPFYDSLLAKVIATGPDRSTALTRLRHALDELAIEGVGTNIAFLRDLMAQPAFADTPPTTDLIARAFPSGWRGPAEATPEEFAVAAALHVTHAAGVADGPWRTLAGWRIAARAGAIACSTLVLAAGDAVQTVRLTGARGLYRVEIGPRACAVRIAGGARTGAPIAVEVDGHVKRYTVAIDQDGIHFGGRSFRIADRTGPRSRADDAGCALVAPLPGVVVEVRVPVGAVVARDDAVIVMEAMKLVHTLGAPAAGRVRAVHCRPGTTVQTGTLLLEVEA